MKKLLLFTLFFLQILRGVTTAQNPYESIGKTTEVLTLSNGKYQEFFPNDTIVRIGSVLFNRVTNEVVEFLTEKDSSSLVEADVASRFLSVDPIGRKYPELTPYQFASNTPIQASDLDGLEALGRISYDDLGDNGVSVYRTPDAVHIMHIYNGQTVHTSLSSKGVNQYDLENSPFSTFFSDIGVPNHLNEILQADAMTRGTKSNRNVFWVMVDMMHKDIIASADGNPEKTMNSMLHFMGSALTSIYMGEEKAKYVADLHERGFCEFIQEEVDATNVFNYLGQSKMVKDKLISEPSMVENYEDSYRDLINNEWGRKFGTELKSQMNIDLYKPASIDNTVFFLNKTKERFEKTFNIKLNNIDKNDKRVIRFNELINDTFHKE